MKIRVVRSIVHVLLRVFGRTVAALVERAARRTSLQAGIALIYHGVGEPRRDVHSELVRTHSASLFERHVEYLRARYRVVPASELFAAACARRRGDRFPLAITFDDDLASHVTVALPILRRAGIPATFFLCGASLEVPFAFWWERLQRAFDRKIDDVPALVGASALGAESPSIFDLAAMIETMTPEERERVSARLAHALGADPETAGLRADDVRKLASSGMEIGFHTLRHDPLPPLDDAALARALLDGRERLEAVVGTRLRTIAYPHGCADGRVATAARRAGFEVGFTGERQVVRPGSDPLVLGRVGPSYRSVGHLALRVVWTLVAGRRAAAAPVPRSPAMPATRQPSSAK